MSGDSKGGNMYFFQSPSLECLTLVKIATLLFDEYQAYDVFLMQKVRSPPQSLRYKDWTRSIFERVEYDMELRAEKLPLPEKLKNKIYSLFRPLAVQVLYWKEYDDDYFVFKMFQRNFKKVSWTQQGIIDKRKTYEPVVKFQALDVEYRYKLACKCCLENDIPVLWEQMLETERNKIIFNTRDSSIIDLRDLLDGLLYFWSCKMKGEVFSLKDMTENYSTYTPSQYMFEYAAVKGNKAALAYFFEKLTPDEKNYSLLKTAKHVCSLCYYNMRYDNPYCYYGDILCFLLSQIDKEQHKDVIEKNYGVLFHFLEWPCQGFVLDAADLVWADIKGDLFVKLLYQVAVKIMLHYEDYNYRELLGEFSHRSLSSHKKYIFDC